MNTTSQGIHDDSSSYPSYSLPLSYRRKNAAVRLVDQLIRAASEKRFPPEAYVQAEAALASLPLMTTEFGLASARLKNALAYARQHEHGAAVIELRQLRRQLS